MRQETLEWTGRERLEQESLIGSVSAFNSQKMKVKKVLIERRPTAFPGFSEESGIPSKPYEPLWLKTSILENCLKAVSGVCIYGVPRPLESLGLLQKCRFLSPSPDLHNQFQELNWRIWHLNTFSR